MRSEAKSRTAAAWVSLLMGCLATVAAAAGEKGDESVKLCDPCTEPNGRGIYIADPLHYCIDDKVDEVPVRFCPEAFINVPAHGGIPAHVELEGSYFVGTPLTETTLPAHPTVSVRLQNGKLAPVVGIITETTSFLNSEERPEDSSSKLKLVYKDNLSPAVMVSSENLKDLTLHILSPRQPKPQARVVRQPLAYLLTFEQVAVPDATSPTYQYMVSWKSTKPQAQVNNLCSGGQTMSVLPGRRVNAKGGTVTEEEGTTTMACATGAIVQCMSWGYRPENIEGESSDENSLMGACIQAKRAAYFGGPVSYTQNGHTIGMLDFLPDPIRGDSFTYVEAIWKADKAFCINSKLRRVKFPDAPELPPHWEEQVPECGFDELPTNWAKNGFIVTGTAPATAPAPGP